MIPQIFGIIILLAATAYLLRGFGWQGATVFAAIAAVLLLREGLEPLSYVFTSIKSLGGVADIAEPVSAAIKVLGLGYLFGICADICRDLGEAGLAKATETVGRVEVIAVVIPYFEEIIRVGVEFIG